MKRKVRSMLNPSAYPQASPNKWLLFAKSRQRRIDPVFAARLAALARSRNKKITITSGFRTKREQLYWYKLRKGKGALKPGTSWHEYGGAADSISSWVRKLDNVELSLQLELARFGLCKPLALGNDFYPPEDWHLQPIELAHNNLLTTKKRFYRAYRGTKRKKLRRL